MNIARAILPYPVLSLAILALWLALAQTISTGQVLLGGALALAIPIFTARFWPDRPRTVRLVPATRLFFVVLADIVLANIAVARLILGPLGRLHPSFFELPLDIRDHFVATVLGSIISLTPGTVSVDIDRERWTILVHALDVDDAEAMMRHIKTRYEAPLREVFSC